ncbi:hypothetical protein [Paenibacillus riograndensis]|uniref:Uncharacterized protein n=1 Tax=Paenibacillus riograndensis SBR5 TaxID=1073571 RepID=A0A0E4HFA8_9BACL|nr:hypothetical protein [Paenibacillus riograndensis]CQR58254.1 hypothetical protein PRIO_5885 [Paenibacillus riograndensis SBR5]
MKDTEEEVHEEEAHKAPISTTGGQDKKECLFWSFPHGKGAIQPWRRRLWELQNNSDRE